MDNTELLNKYVQTGCEEAFSELVSRHIDLVYASARRLTRDAHLAEDVTQAVFIVLARKANRVTSGAVLPAWLLSATRYASSNANTMESRRRKYEKAAAMDALHNAANAAATDVSVTAADGEMSATLDSALGRLGAVDRSAVAMRYLQGKSIRDIAAAMGISPEAAQKRVLRALAKLRDYFARRGVRLDGTELDASLTRQMQQVAPAALAPAVAAKALWAKSAGATAVGTGTGAGAGIGASTAIAQVVIRSLTWVTTAKVAAACTIAAVVVGASAVAVQSARNPAPVNAAVATTAPATRPTTRPLPPPKPFVSRLLSAEDIWQPYVPSLSPGRDVVVIKNDSLKATERPNYFTGLDPEMRRGKDSDPAAKISSTSSAAVGAAMIRVFDAAPYRGKRIRVSGYVKSEDVAIASGFTLWAFRADGAALAQDDLGGRWVYGTHDWARHDIVADISEQAQGIRIYGYLRGPGTVWIDGLELAVVDSDVPINDCHRWRGWTQTPAKYNTAIDRKVLLNGHPTIRLSSDTTPDFMHDWLTYDHTEPDVRPFLGKKIRLTAMIRSENADYAGPIIRAVGVANTTAKRDAFSGKRPVRGTTGWLKYATTMDFPKDAVDISYGVTLSGKGKVWFGDLKMEIVE